MSEDFSDDLALELVASQPANLGRAWEDALLSVADAGGILQGAYWRHAPRMPALEQRRYLTIQLVDHPKYNQKQRLYTLTSLGWRVVENIRTDRAVKAKAESATTAPLLKE